jgi:hypothetical protein
VRRFERFQPARQVVDLDLDRRVENDLRSPDPDLS